MTMEDVREYEKNMHEKTNIKVCNQHSSPVDEIDSHAKGSTQLLSISYVTDNSKNEINKALDVAFEKSEACSENSAHVPLTFGVLIDNYMTMDEVREFERATQEATNKKIGVFPPAISISDISLPSSIRSAPSSAPTTPLSTDAPEFLAVPKDRPRKKSAPETLTLPDPDKEAL
ncbi:hypothetical protein JD844_011261 [Phrynosoma platyrhinos]|uniref:Uncharacterized protein n=1 Tax=Phrynosoma platyrhinos TaxID=52577 RepID=A0ABQ7TIY5_PHRPL|nr:hypothetical protein JD844_011261 [Phrynosoma platyrhinos]